MGELTGEEERERGEGQGARLLGVLGGRAGCRREARWLLLYACCSCSLAVPEKKVGGRRREEKREKRKEEGKGKEKREKGEIFQTWKFLEKIKDNL
jgi:hypothetical protein